jgi:hypothetical protein
MARASEEELARIGKERLRVVALAKSEDIIVEHDHVRFRDSDLSIKGGALLGFGGLMLAADLVVLSAAPDSFIDKLYHDRRRRWFLGRAWLIAGGTLVYVAAILGHVCLGRCL